MTRVQSPSPYAVNACIRWMKVSGKVLTHPDRGLGGGGPGSLTLVLRRICRQCRDCDPPKTPFPSHRCFCLLTLFQSCSLPTPHALLSLFHSPNINRVIWMSYIAGKLWWCQLLCADLLVAFLLKARQQEIDTGSFLSSSSNRVIYYVNWFQFSSHLHTTNNKTILISRIGKILFFFCSPGWSCTTELLGLLWKWRTLGKMSVCLQLSVR